MRAMILLAAAAASLLPVPAFADARDFTLVNNTGRVISELYVSPARADNWEEDVLGVDTLADEQKVSVSFSDDTDACVYDLKIVHDDGDSAIWTGINLCKVSEVNVQYDDDGQPIAATE